MERGGRAGLQPAAGGGGGGGGGGWVLVEVRLRGGAPWGFTVQGGLEHNEPLLISKVEEGGKVDCLERPLLVGDEIIAINEVELSGYRQEAIALVKASHKTLQLTVRRDLDPGFIEEFGTSCSSAPPSPPSTPLAAQQPPSPGSPHQSRPAATEEVQLRFKNRRNEPASRPHSWHSSKLGEGQRDVDPDAMDAGGGGWYHPSASTADLSAGFDSGTYLRKSPDQYSSRGSMESLDAPGPSQHHPGVHHQHPLGREAHGGAHPAYSSCHQLCSSRSSNSIDHLHSKRDSAYSSVSTGSSVPEYLAATPTFSPERSCSLEAVPQLHYARAASDQQQQQQRPAQEHEPSGTTAPLLRHAEPRSRGPGSSGPSRDPQAGGVCYRGNRGGGGGGGVPASNRHSVGPIWGPAVSCSSYENLKGAPAPPRRSDSYAALRNHDRPNSWSSLEHARSLRSLQKGSWHHSSGPVASGPAKGSYGPEGPLHTVMEKSPESSPTTRPRQGGGFSQPHSPGGPGPPDLASVAPPTGKQPPLPQAEPHSAPAPNGSWAAASPGVYRKEGEREERRDGGMGVTQNGHHLFSSSSSTAGAPAPTADSRGEEPSALAFVTPLLPAPPASAAPPHPLRLHGDAAAPWELDREHPLTRLELALAEVQRGPASQSHVPIRFHDDDGGAAEPGRGPARSPARSLSVLEKVSRFERRERAGKQRSHSTCTSGNSAKAGEKGVTGAEDLRNMLERSNGGARAHRTMSYRGGSGEHARHRFPADPSLALQRSRSTAQLKEADAWKEDVQEMLDHLQDASSTRSYRDSLKDAQSKVLGSTSFRRRDLTSSTRGPAHVSSNPQPWSQDKKGPKTLPKPQGLFLPPQATASPHTPKERQEVSPGARGPSPPALPSIPPVGPPPRTRICGRRRLAAEQKKRSYSEPDKMNEIGVSDPETAALYRRGGETSVADRRRMFELAASGAANGPLPSSRSRPDLRQAQHDALAEYVVRKKALKREEGSRGPGARPRSVYLPPEGSSHTTSCSLSDAASISSTSSLLSLLEAGPDLSRVTTPRPPAHSPPSPSFSCPPGLQDRAHPGPGPEAEPNRENGSSGGHLLQVQPRRAPAEPQQNPGMSKKLSSALQRAQSIRDSGKSASTEDLLERSEEGRAAPRHQRSRSSPAEGSLSQDIPPAAAATLGAFLPAAANRFADTLASGDQVSQQHSQNRLNTVQPERRLQDADPPVPRRERARRSGERQRSSATSTLAASVGLQCPLTPSGIGGGASGDWRASERLSQVNLDAIVFPGVSDGGPSGPSEAEPQSLSAANGPDRSRTPPSPPTTQPEPRWLRISEPGLTGSGDQRLLDADVSQADSDEVFLHDLEDFPPPPPPDVDPGAGSQTGGSSPPSSPPSSSPLHSPPGPGLPPDLERQPPGVASEAPPALALEYQPLPRREKTYEDLRVEALAKQLVWRDSSLAPLLDMFGVKSTMELMEEVFTPNSRLGGKSPWQRRGSRVQDAVCDPPEMDPDQTQDEDLNAKKVELCEALRCSVAALQQEREALREEQRHHRALGASIDSLVQERLKANERDKYSVFVGDLERIVNLLLSLCSRLMRIDRALLALERDPLLQEDAAEERDSLLHKRSLVLRQTDDAQELKENLERRQRVVHGILSGYLTPAQLRDYRGFISAKPSLLIRQRHLDNLIRHREEHLSRLADSFPRELADGGLRGRPFSPPSPTPLPFPPITTPGPAPPVRPTPVTSL